MSVLGQIFSSGVANKIEILLDDVQNSGVLDPVSTTAFPKQTVAVQAGTQDRKLKVFDLTADLDASASASVEIDTPATEVSPAFTQDEGLVAPTGTSYAVLHVDGKLSAGVSGSVTSVPLSISASGAATFAYDHYLAVAPTDKRLDALKQLVATAQLPQFESLTSLQQGEVSRFEATLNLDLGIKAKFGSSFDVASVVKLFDGLSGQVTANVQYSLEASLGWSMFDDFVVAVGKAQQKNAGWVRVRIDRSKKKTFTAGATFSLKVDYDASSIGDALEKAFDMSPLPRAIAVLRNVSEGNWDEIKTTITDKASDELISLIAGTGWKEKAANSPDVTKAIALIDKTVSIYDGIDDKVKQLWDALLVRVDLEPGSKVRTALDKIAALNPSDPDLQQFLSPQAQTDLQMLESLTGVNIEQLLIGTNVTVQKAIDRAIDLAKQAERVINDTPTDVTNALQKFAKDHGIASVIQWLSTNATSLDAIQQFGDSEIQKFVGKAVGKVFSSVNDQDVQKVQKWAAKLVAQWDALSKKLAAAAKLLKGAVGFDVSLEFSRVSESSAVLDFELDPTVSAVVNAVTNALPSGNVQKMLAALDGIPADDDGNLPYTIREAIFISRHLRTGAATVLLSFIGLSKMQKVTGSRFDESILQFTDTGRTGSFSGGFTQAVTIDKASSECGVWISADAADQLKGRTEPFSKVTRGLHLTFARHDDASTQEELGALQTLLLDLGFPAINENSLSAPAGAEIAFTMDIVLDENALNAFVGDDGEDNWNRDYRNAAFRLLKDDMVADQLASVGQPVGEVLASVVQWDQFAETWTDNSETKFKQRYSEAKLQISGKTLPIVQSDRIVPPYLPIKMMIRRRPNGLRALKPLGEALARSANGNPSDLTRLSTASAAMLASTSLPEWDNPMFNFWFVVARLARLNVLAKAVGLATFRFRTSSSAELSAPMQWSLEPNKGVPVTTIQQRRLFPFA